MLTGNLFLRLDDDDEIRGFVFEGAAGPRPRVTIGEVELCLTASQARRVMQACRDAIRATTSALSEPLARSLTDEPLCREESLQRVRGLRRQLRPTEWTAEAERDEMIDAGSWDPDVA